MRAKNHSHPQRAAFQTRAVPDLKETFGLLRFECVTESCTKYALGAHSWGVWKPMNTGRQADFGLLKSERGALARRE